MRRNWTGSCAECVIVLLDEAYREFASGPDAPDGLRFVREGLPVLCLRTFSKAYGLAGLRVGYLLGDPALLDAIRRVREAYPVSRPAQAAACAALDDGDFLRRTLALNEESKAYFSGELSGLGLPFVPTSANFVFVDMRRDVGEAAQALLARGFQIRPGTLWCLPTWARPHPGDRGPPALSCPHGAGEGSPSLPSGPGW